MMNSPASILARAGLALLMALVLLFYVGVCLIMDKGISWPPVIVAAVVAWCIAPSKRELETVAGELEAHIKHIASDD